MSVWKGWPFAFLIVMAGLQNIPRELYEAAAIDGAGIWQQIRKITLPSLRPVNQVLVLVLFLWTFNDFNTPYVLFGKAAPEAADLISIHIYQSSFVTWNFGSGSAMSVLLLLFLLRGDGRLSAAHLARKEDRRRCLGPRAGRSPMARRRSPSSGPGAIVLTLLTGFVLLPVYVMLSSSLKPLAGRHGQVPVDSDAS